MNCRQICSETKPKTGSAFEHPLEETIWMKHGGEETGILSASKFLEYTVTTFEHDRIRSGNRGLVLRTAKGAEFQISIVQTKAPSI